jgi:hypothetical protein
MGRIVFRTTEVEKFLSIDAILASRSARFPSESEALALRSMKFAVCPRFMEPMSIHFATTSAKLCHPTALHCYDSDTGRPGWTE